MGHGYLDGYNLIVISMILLECAYSYYFCKKRAGCRSQIAHGILAGDFFPFSMILWCFIIAMCKKNTGCQSQIAYGILACNRFSSKHDFVVLSYFLCKRVGWHFGWSTKSSIDKA